MAHPHSTQVPRGALMGAAGLILLSVGLAASARSAALAAPLAREPPPIAAVELRFEDQPDGSLAVLDAVTGREVEAVPPGTNGFIRGVLRGMFRTRKLESIDRSGAFRLSRQASGRLVLEDLQSGRRVDLDSFGATNSAAFARLLGEDHDGIR